MGSLDKIGTVLATKVLCDNITVAEDVVITLPDIEFVTSEIKAMGTLNVPTPLTNPIEPTITSVGMDNGLYNMLGLSSKTFEKRRRPRDRRTDARAQSTRQGVEGGMGGGARLSRRMVRGHLPQMPDRGADAL